PTLLFGVSTANPHPANFFPTTQERRPGKPVGRNGAPTVEVVMTDRTSDGALVATRVVALGALDVLALGVHVLPALIDHIWIVGRQAGRGAELALEVVPQLVGSLLSVAGAHLVPGGSLLLETVRVLAVLLSTVPSSQGRRREERDHCCRYQDLPHA